MRSAIPSIFCRLLLALALLPLAMPSGLVLSVCLHGGGWTLHPEAVSACEVMGHLAGGEGPCRACCEQPTDRRAELRDRDADCGLCCLDLATLGGESCSRPDRAQGPSDGVDADATEDQSWSFTVAAATRPADSARASLIDLPPPTGRRNLPLLI